ncbi:PKD domain-containing protein [Bdellovibrio sp. BCCA]|uniref:PKD domain-containing protein n=1 Tax=Bdellovibrio sp. BCCA TaxID=3136281 RepID=UPI0030F104EB
MIRLITMGILLWGSFAMARSPNLQTSNPIQFSKFLKKLNQSVSYSIASVRFSPAQPEQGEKVTVFVELSTDFEGNKTVRSIVSLKIDGREVRINNRSETLWISAPVIFHSNGEHTIEVSAFIEDFNASQQARDLLIVLNREIDKLTNDIARETDIDKKNQLQATLDQKNTQKIDLETTLNSLKRPVANKTEKLTVVPSSGSVYPRINECEPRFGSIAGGYEIKVNGGNLEDVDSLTIAGITLDESQLTRSYNQISFIAPSIPDGMQDIVVTKTINGETASTILKNAFYALDGNFSGPSGDIHPVAFAGFPQNVQSGVSAQLDGSKSYDERGKNLTYSWSVVSKPEGATALDGVFNDSSVVNPTFLAQTSGSYVISLVVSNGTLESVPSLTVITVGAIDALTITPLNIAGSALSGEFYIGMFRACNNLPTEASYQILGSGFSLVNGSRQGSINARSCMGFQFSVAYSGNSELRVDIPIILKGTVTSRKIVHVSIVPAVPSSLSFFGKINSLQWSGDQNLDVLAGISPIGLYGTYDTPSATIIRIRNTSNTSYTITSPPQITHMGGTSGIFSMSIPPSGLHICSGCEVEVPINVSPGNFNGAETAQAIFEWDAIPGESSKVFILKTAKLPAPNSYSKELNFGDIVVGSYGPVLYPDFLNDFFGTVLPYGLYEVSSIVEGTTNNFSWSVRESTPCAIGSIDYLQTNMDVTSYVRSSSTAGTLLDEVQINVSGYTTPFKYVLKANVVPSVLNLKNKKSFFGSAK